MRIRIDLRDRATWTALALGIPLLFASGVLVWGYFATARPVHIPDPTASPLIATNIRGERVLLAGTQPPATPTPAPREGELRVEGVVVDELGRPLDDVCIAIGPRGCQKTGPKTDSRGVYYIDFPPGDVSWTLHFIREGYPEIVHRLVVTRNTVINVVMGP